MYRRKYAEEGDTIVYVDESGAPQSLKDVFDSMGIDAYTASVDFLGVHALGSCFQRFDLFNEKYNPFGQRALRDVFLKADNYINGRQTLPPPIAAAVAADPVSSRNKTVSLPVIYLPLSLSMYIYLYLYI